jgi:hypothetical protein
VGVPTCKHVQHPVEELAGEGVIAHGSPHHCEEPIHRPGLNADHGDYLLRKDIQTVFGDGCLFDGVGLHGSGNDERFHKIFAVADEDASLACGTHKMSRSSHPLQAAGDALGLG